jgi:hypothetical protein
MDRQSCLLQVDGRKVAIDYNDCEIGQGRGSKILEQLLLRSKTVHQETKTAPTTEQFVNYALQFTTTFVQSITKVAFVLQIFWTEPELKQPFAVLLLVTSRQGLHLFLVLWGDLGKRCTQHLQRTGDITDQSVAPTDSCCERSGNGLGQGIGPARRQG